MALDSRSSILRHKHVNVMEAAALLGVHPLSVHRYIRNGKLRSVLVAGSRWIPKAAIAARYHELLANPDTREATIDRLRAIADAAGVELDLEGMVAGVDAAATEGTREAARA